MLFHPLNKTVGAKAMTMKSLSAVFLVVMFLCVLSVSGQTSAFTQQGQLNVSGNPANGNFDFEFKLFDAGAGGAQQGSTLQRLNVAVVSGIYAVVLDFGAAALPGANRFLDISVKPAGGGAFTQLTPRQPVTSAPYTVRSLSAATADNATQLGGVAANQYLQTNGNGSGLTSLNASSLTTGTLANSRLGLIPTANIADGAVTSPKIAVGQVVKSINSLNDSVTLAAGSNITITPSGNTLTIATTSGGNPILNQLTQQVAANFNIDGNGTAGGTLRGDVVRAETQYNIGVNRILSTGQENMLVGIDAGIAITTGSANSFFGRSAGSSNTGGTGNSFFGRSAGASNLSGDDNSFFGRIAGQSNTSGFDNSFFGRSAGNSNTTGNDNSFFGRSAGNSNTIGSNNSFFGRSAGEVNSIGGQNSFFGHFAGSSNAGGGSNSFFGTAAGSSNTSGNDNAFFGIFAGDSNTTGDGNTFFGRSAGEANTTGNNNTIIGTSANVGAGNLTFATAIGAGAVVIASNTVELGRFVDTVVIRGGLIVGNFAASGLQDVCRNASNQMSACSSSLRYKTNISQFSQGMSFVNKLSPISFDWKDGGMKDVGFGAEDIAKIDPRFVTFNDKGEVEGVKYTRLSVAFVNAFKEQQAEIDEQRRQIEEQRSANTRLQAELTALKALVCATNKETAVCKEF